MMDTRRSVPGGPLGAALVALIVAASAASAQIREKEAPAPGLGIDTVNFDRGARPQDDFARFVNGSWEARTQIPADRSGTGAFVELRDAAELAVRQIIEGAAADPGPAGSERQKIGDLYASYMDTAGIDEQGLSALQPQLAAFAAIRSAADLPAAFARAGRLGSGTALYAAVGADPKNSAQNIVSIGQDGLTLPDRDYYLRQDAKFVAIRKAYTDYIGRLLTLAGQPDPTGSADRILALETVLAGKQWDRVRNRDRNATYNKMSRAQLQALTPDFDWSVFLQDAGLAAAGEVVVRQPDYLQALDTILTSTPAATWREYLTFKLLDDVGQALPAFGPAHFQLYGRTLEGLEAPRPRWKDAVSAVQGALGEAVGKLYVQQHFQPDAKLRMDALVRNLLAAYRVSIDSLAWMSPTTRAQAQQKLARFTVKIGYPDKWRDYSTLTIRRGDLLGDLMQAQAYRYQDMIDRLGKPVDRTRWGMTPQTVNAYYNPSNNEIVFPAAILQPPFFNVDADEAVNYGAIGAVIGHEISHGFDDQGSKSDGDGNLRDWWTPQDQQAFQQLTGRLVQEYAAYEPIDTLHINGKLTLGENIADVSGLAVAYRAYHMSLAGRPAPVIDGFTGDQRFFMGWTQVWRTKIRPEALRNQLLTDPHSPGNYRAFVPLTNLDAFYRAWDIQPGDRLYRPPAERVRIW